MIKQNFVINEFGFPEEIQKLDFIGLGLRKNPKRSQLYVSELLGKHVPQEPEKIVNHAKSLAEKIILSDSVIFKKEELRTIVIGFSETATALGENVARELGVPYITTTRYPIEPTSFAFSEEHSHAVEQVLAPSEDFLEFMKEKPLHLIFVDDEMSTGKTFINALTALARGSKLEIKSASFASLLSTVDKEDSLCLKETKNRLSLDYLSVISLHSQQIRLPEQFHNKAQKFVEEYKDKMNELEEVDFSFISLLDREIQFSSRGVRVHKNYDFLDENVYKLEKIKDVKNIFEQDTLYIVGEEEFMFPPLYLAQTLAKKYPMKKIKYSSTTRSPIMVMDRESYPIRLGVSSGSTDGVSRFLYNIPKEASVIFVTSSKATESQREFTAHLLGFYKNSIGVII